LSVLPVPKIPTADAFGHDLPLEPLLEARQQARHQLVDLDGLIEQAWPTQSAPTPKLLTIEDAAAQVGMDAPAFLKVARKHNLTRHLGHRTVRVDAAALTRFIGRR